MAQTNNKFSVFASNSESVFTDEVYASSSDRESGNQEGAKASATLNNTALKQASLIAVAVVEYLASKNSSKTFNTALSVEEISQIIADTITSQIPTKTSQLENDSKFSTTSILSGTEEPSPELGKNGDLYVKFE